MRLFLNNCSVILTFLFATLLVGCFSINSEAAEVIVVGDSHLKPVSEVISGIRKTLRASLKIYSPSEVKGSLGRIVEKEDAKVVVALGRDALEEALRLPPAFPVIFDLVVIPPSATRPHTTGFYMAAPAREYLELINSYFRSLRRISVVARREQLSALTNDVSSQITTRNIKNSFEFVTAIQQLDNVDAILLLPDTSILTASAMEEVNLYSFRRRVPLLGFSERNVREGALLALVGNMGHIGSHGRQIGEYANKALRGINIGQFPPTPPSRFDLYLNTDTARKMNIHIPDEIMRRAKRVYP
jgi:putative tryptophan/tyrosine transport system substrate-binding protein